MNKSVKRLVSVLLAAAVLSVLGVSALADVPNSDEYTVTMSAGNILNVVEGAYIDGPSSWTVKAGEQLTLSSVEGLENSPYFYKGVRPAGRDNSVIYSSNITVTEDADYVAAYGLRGDLVAYTITYRNADGEDLVVDNESHYGNVGDKIVVGSRDIDGYQPQAYQLAKTLVEDAAENVFPFVYTPVVVPTPIPAAPAPTPYVYTEGAAGGGAAGGAGAGEAAGGGLPAGGGAVAQPGAGGEEAVEGGTVPEAGTPGEEETAPVQEPAAEEQTAPAAETAQIDQDESPQANAPQEYIDLDKTPSGEKPEIKEKPPTELQQERTQSEQKLYIAAGLLGVSLIAIVALVVALVRRRKA